MKTRTKIICAVSILLALCAWGAVALEIQDVMGHMADVDSDTQQIVTDETDAVSTQSLRKAFYGVGEDSHIFDAYFVSATDTPVFIENIEGVAQANRLTISIGSVSIAPATGGSSLAMTVSVTGAQKDILHFVQLLELMPYAVSVAAVDLQAPDRGDGSTAAMASTSSTQWRADIQFSVAAQ